jgi:hypothetical protein
VAKKILETVEKSANAKKELPFACLKITGLADHALLEKMSECVTFKAANPSYQLPWETTLPKQSSSSPAATFAAVPPTFTPEEMAKLDDFRNRLEKICNRAWSYGVPLLIDAEQTVYQPAIDYLGIVIFFEFLSSANNKFTHYLFGV